MKLADIADAVGGRLVGDGDIDIARLVPPREAQNDSDLPLVFSSRALSDAIASPAIAALLVTGLDVPDGRLSGYVEVPDPRAALAVLSLLFARPVYGEPGIHPTAVIHDDAELGADVSVGPYAVIGPDTEIGAATRILSHVSIGAGAKLGDRCLIHAGVRIADGVTIGDRVILHPNACIGADGFSYATPEPPQTGDFVRTREITPYLHSIDRIASLGTVILGDDVEVGAGTTIDRATVGVTRIGRNTKIDNLVMIGHNCVIGENCLIVAQVGISGSVTIGDRVVLAGKVGVADHITIGDDATLAARAGVRRDVPERALLLGDPAMPTADYFNRLKHTHVSRLARNAEKLRDLADRVGRLESGEDND